MFVAKAAKAAKPSRAEAPQTTRGWQPFAKRTPSEDFAPEKELEQLGREQVGVPAWNFSSISVFAPQPADRASSGTKLLPANLQPKLAIGAVNDPLESEADRIAAQVLSPGAVSSLSPAPAATQPPMRRKEEEETWHVQREAASSRGPAQASESVHAALRSAGRPLAPSDRQFFEKRLGHDLSRVRIHSDPEGARSATSVNALAYTVGQHVVFGPGSYQPGTPSGRQLLAHELVHTIQQSGGRTPASARSTATPLLQRQPKPDQTKITPPADEDPLHGWVHPHSALMLLQSGDKTFLVPAQQYVLVPPSNPVETAVNAPAHFSTDVGNLFAVPASGASGTRVFQAGKRTALLIDAGSDPSMGVRVQPTLPTPTTGQAAIYMGEFTALMSNLGLDKVSKTFVIHGHLDHVGGIPAITAEWGTLAENVVIPREYQNLTAVRQAVNALKTTTDPVLVQRGFGAAWNPQYRLKDKGVPGSNVLHTDFTIGELRVESLGLRSELQAVKTNASRADISSLLTRVTRKTDLARVVVLGDLRGRDLETIKSAMEAESPGSWNAFFEGTTTLSGFSHHAGRLDAADIPGIMSLLDATLLKTGKLNVVEQTNPAAPREGQSRVETLDLLSNLGANVSYSTLPGAGVAPSSVTATRDTVTTSGPNAVVNPVTQSNLTTGLGRLQKMLEIQDTVEKWRPWFEEIAGPAAVNDMVRQIQDSTTTLRSSLRNASEAAVAVRTVARTTAAPAATPPAGGAAPAASPETQRYQAALAAIPAQTPVEEAMKPAFLESLEKLREMNVEEIPGRIAVHQALTKGVYSDQAFTYLLGQLDPKSRDELLVGPRGGPVPRQKAFERVRFEVEFRRSVLGSETWSVSGFSPGPARAAAYGFNVFMLALELWNDIGQPLLEAHRNSEKIKEATQVVPFLRRIMFWQKMGAQVLYTGVHDPTFGSPSYFTNAKEINDKMSDLDALFMQSPGLTDGDVLRVAAFLSYNVRNFDEFAEIFQDTKQDAVTWDTPADKAWENATWKIKTGYYETSGSNHVEEKWEDNPKFTQFMHKFIPMIIANTETLLGQYGTGKSTPQPLVSQIGDLSIPGHPIYRARLRKDAAETPVQIPVPWTGGPSHPNLNRSLKWWSPPVFYVLEDGGKTSTVTGADYNTYALLRKQESETHTLTADVGGNYDAVHVIGNQPGTVIIDSDLLERIPEPGAANQQAPGAQAPGAQTPGTVGSPGQPSVRILQLPGVGPRDVQGPSSGPNIGPQVFDKPGGDPSKGGDQPNVLPGVKIPIPGT